MKADDGQDGRTEAKIELSKGIPVCGGGGSRAGADVGGGGCTCCATELFPPLRPANKS